MQSQPRPPPCLPCLGPSHSAHWYLQRRHGRDSPPPILPQGHRLVDRLQPPLAAPIYHGHGFYRPALSQHHLETLQHGWTRRGGPRAHSLSRRVQQPPVELLHPPSRKQLAQDRCQDYLLDGKTLGIGHPYWIYRWIYDTRPIVQGVYPEQAFRIETELAHLTQATFPPAKVAILPPDQPKEELRAR